MDANIVQSRRSGRPAVPPARLRHAGQPGAAAGFGMTAAPSGGGARGETPTGGAESPSPSPERQELDSSALIARIQQQLAASDKPISTPPLSDDEDVVDVSGDTPSVQSILNAAGIEGSTPGRDQHTSGRNKHSRVRSPLSDERRGTGSDDEASEDDADEQGQQEVTDERSRPQEKATGKGKGKGKGRGRPREYNPADAMNRKRKASPPLSQRQPPKEKRYVLWSLAVLRKVCHQRGVKGQQRCSDKDVLSNLLEQADEKEGRISPYTGDFGGDLPRAKGKKPGKQSDSDIPAGVLLAFRTMLDAGKRKKRAESVLFEGKAYGVGRLLDALEEGRGGESQAGADGKQGNRKTPNCFPRLVNIMVGSDFRGRMIESEAQATRAELDNGAVGARRSVWVDLTQAFINPNAKVGFMISDHDNLQHLEPGTCFQPNMTPGKLKDMYNAVRKSLGRATTNCKQSGMGNPFWNFCAEDTDVLYLHEAGEKYPELRELCQTSIPEEIAQEAGMSESGGDESSGDDEPTAGGESTTSRAEAQKLKAKARAKQVSKRRKRQAKEAFNDALPNMRRELAAGAANASAAIGAIPVVDGDLAREKHQADIDLQKARLAKVQEEKGMHAIETRKLLAEERQRTRDEYKRLRAEIRTEKAATEPDAVYITTLERDLATVRDSL